MGDIIAAVTVFAVLSIISFLVFACQRHRRGEPSEEPRDESENGTGTSSLEQFPLVRQSIERQRMQDEGFIYFDEIQRAASVHNFPEAVRLAEEHLSHFDLTQSHFASGAHFFLINCVQIIYFRREEDPLAYNHCLMLCDADIALYPYLDRGIVRNNPVLPEKKAIIMEKMGWYEDALRVCEDGIRNGWGTASMPWETRAERLKRKLSRHQ